MKPVQQATSHILMVRPAHFGYNQETAVSNAFQTMDESLRPEEARRQAVLEFDTFVEKLRSAGVDVIVLEDTDTPVKPDAVFPNNWITFHEDGTVATYPMNAPARRLERREDVLETLGKRFLISQHLRFEHFEEMDMYLEGTGSLILDRPNRIAYACLSPRTDEHLLDDFCDKMGYEKLAFIAVDGNGQEVYHTNVMMALGDAFVVVCLESVRAKGERERLLNKFAATKKEIIEISLDQMMAFAGNMLQVRSRDGKPLLVMSEQAYKSLRPEQVQQIEKHA
ncbi:MAG: amidinotransferase, partial [Phaeodactylibacter sp.]|nr:amidinotransferase [Phaeodactylibacter sp.]